MWLTAWCVRVLHAVSFQDWEDFIYIDPEVFGHAVMWLLNFQNSEGAFVEANDVDTPLHYAMRTSMYASNYSAHAALTAHVLIAMDDAAPLLTGHIKVIVTFTSPSESFTNKFFLLQQYCSTGRQRAIKFLERNVFRITDPYEVAIITYALAKSRSPEADMAMSKLMALKRDEGSFVYWSRTKINPNRVRYEFNRPFMEAKDRQLNDALAVEATGYALLSLFQLEGGGITILQDEIVR